MWVYWTFEVMDPTGRPSEPLKKWNLWSSEHQNFCRHWREFVQSLWPFELVDFWSRVWLTFEKVDHLGSSSWWLWMPCIPDDVQTYIIGFAQPNWCAREVSLALKTGSLARRSRSSSGYWMDKTTWKPGIVRVLYSWPLSWGPFIMLRRCLMISFGEFLSLFCFATPLLNRPSPRNQPCADRTLPGTDISLRCTCPNIHVNLRYFPNFNLGNVYTMV